MEAADSLVSDAWMQKDTAPLVAAQSLPAASRPPSALDDAGVGRLAALPSLPTRSIAIGCFAFALSPLGDKAVAMMSSASAVVASCSLSLSPSALPLSFFLSSTHNQSTKESRG